jgi:hypothetical protein
MKANPIVAGAQADRKPHYPFPRAANRESGRVGRDGAKVVTLRPTEALQPDSSMGSPKGHAAAGVRPYHERASLEPLKDESALAPMQGEGSSVGSRSGKRGRGSFKTMNAFKSSPDWQYGCWKRWPKEDSWPGVLDLYEAAARVRMSPDSLRRAAATGRDGRAKLAHRRIGISYRFSLREIDNYGLIHAR